MNNGKDFVVSEILIPPHAPGYSHFDVTFIANTPPPDEAKPDVKDDSKTDAKPVAPKSIGVDLLTDQGYSGALRLGISKLYGVTDHAFSVSMKPGAMQSQIIESSSVPTEIVLGYSLYADAVFREAGRTYNITYGDSGISVAKNWLLRHTSLFVDFGALGYAAGKFDFLRSIYLGGEADISRNISVALAYVGHREDRVVPPFEVGGPAPASGIPTEQRYTSGVALFFTVTSEFFEFSKGLSGVTK